MVVLPERVVGVVPGGGSLDVESGCLVRDQILQVRDHDG